MTPRELAAHERLDRSDRIVAEIMAALHNGPILRRDQSFWTPEMFMHGYRPGPDQSWKAAKATAINLHRKATPEEKAVMETNAKEFQQRTSRAQALKAMGGTREQVIAVMEGRA
jgi:hypothetical protein